MWTTNELLLMLWLGVGIGWFIGFGLGAMKSRESDEVWYWQGEAEKWKRAFTVLKHASENLDAHLSEKLNRRTMGRYETKTATVLGATDTGVSTVDFTQARIHHKGAWIDYGDEA